MLRNRKASLAATAGILAVALLLVAQGMSAQNGTSGSSGAATTPPKTSGVVCCCDPSSQNPHLARLAEDATPQQSIYLSAVRLIEFERAQGSARKALPALEKLVADVREQPLRNAIRRLIVDLYVEEGDLKSADKENARIISESLLQL